MSVDLLLVREEVVGGYNLAVGSPNIIQKHLKFPLFINGDDFSYPNNVGDVSLLKELELIYPNKKIVITNGAKSGILSALYALKNKYNYTHVYHFHPYWLSVPTLANLSSLTFSKNYTIKYGDYIYFLTSPANPTGIEYNNIECDLLDAVYTSPIFDWSGSYPKHKIMVSSASKTLGLPGLRVGWVITEDVDLFNSCAKYVEITSSGISVLSQQFVANALIHMRTNDTHKAIDSIRTDILENGELFKKHLGNVADLVQGVPSNGKGGFVFFKVYKNDIQRFKDTLTKAKVLMVPGETCGMDEPGWFRCNMLQTNEYTDEAFKRIKDCL